jgi:nicotinate-nucleotide adenylyltransferase
MKTVALFGGSFDPPHIGHVSIVEALEMLSFIDSIVVMPTYLNPFKSTFVAPASLRLQWLKKIFSTHHKVEVSSFEVSMNRSVSTMESVEFLKKSYDKIYVVIGADNLASLPKWHHYETLKDMVTFIVASRNNIPIDENYIALPIQEDITSSSLRISMQPSKIPQQCATEIQNYYKEYNANKN